MCHYLTAKPIKRIFMQSLMSSDEFLMTSVHSEHMNLWQMLYPMKSVCYKLLVKYVYGDDVYTQTYNLNAT